jgi:hypothetical protein
MLNHRVLLAALLAVAAVSTVGAHIVIPTGFPELVADAAFILRGRVTDVRAASVPGRGIESIATVAVDHVLKGAGTNFVHVHVPGGVVGDTRRVMIGAPRFAPGDQAVFFLKRGADNAWRPVGLAMGVYRVSTDRRTGRTLVAPPLVVGETAAVGRVVRGDPRRQSFPVSEFESLVRLVMLRPAAPSRGRR